jgi:hypothetical protein
MTRQSGVTMMRSLKQLMAVCGIVAISLPQGGKSEARQDYLELFFCMPWGGCTYATFL